MLEASWQRHAQAPSVRILGYAGIAGTCEAQAHDSRQSTHAPGEIDWQKWRLGNELRLLEWRATRPGSRAEQASRWVSASGWLNAAYGAHLTGRTELAAGILSTLLQPISQVPDRINTGIQSGRSKGAELKLGNIGQFFEDVIGKRPTHRSFHQNATNLEEAIAQRKLYARGSNPCGSFLAGPEIDLIPLDLIHLQFDDPILTEYAAMIKATTYPEEHWFIDLDVQLSIEGL